MEILDGKTEGIISRAPLWVRDRNENTFGLLTSVSPPTLFYFGLQQRKASLIRDVASSDVWTREGIYTGRGDVTI
jgi:hypothetical protein